ncbi:hypothetical protein JTE90_001822 [Oedothorax gibbosus]|uniref:Uncharacterized protein n=1 Tax=Oedothorax gibbosus TaxID=931172 RepID=A0AAV6THN9_9ARAC|nr:hypothetical protein JTE90_001822 [Oedothorax gibbosus]
MGMLKFLKRRPPPSSEGENPSEPRISWGPGEAPFQPLNFLGKEPNPPASFKRGTIPPLFPVPSFHAGFSPFQKEDFSRGIEGKPPPASFGTDFSPVGAGDWEKYILANLKILNLGNSSETRLTGGPFKKFWKFAGNP